MDFIITPLVSAHAWELRALWAKQVEVSLTLDPEIASLERVRGRVVAVAATDAFCVIVDALGEVHVPLAAVLAVRRPHFTEPADARPPAARPSTGLLLPGQLSIYGEEVS